MPAPYTPLCAAAPLQRQLRSLHRRCRAAQVQGLLVLQVAAAIARDTGAGTERPRRRVLHCPICVVYTSRARCVREPRHARPSTCMCARNGRLSFVSRISRGDRAANLKNLISTVTSEACSDSKADLFSCFRGLFFAAQSRAWLAGA